MNFSFKNSFLIITKSVLFLAFLLFTSFHITISAQTVKDPDGSVELANQVKNLYKAGNWEAGKKLVDEGMKKYPKESDLKMLSGRYYHHQKQYDKARYELKKSLEWNAKNVDAKQILVNVEQESKRYSSAICYVNELLEVNPYWKGLWNRKIELYELQGNTVEANRLRKRLSHIYPKDSKVQEDYLYNTEMRANALRKEGKIDEAISLTSDLLKKQPENPSHYISLVNDHLKTGDYYSALAFAERGLMQFPGNISLINKKSGILADQKRYDELLPFLNEQMKYGNRGALQQQYNYYLLEAARTAKDKDPATLYGKIFESSPGNDEAFNYVFNDAVGNQQYEEAIAILNRYRRARGGSKNLSMKELMVYTRMGNTSRAEGLTKQLFAQYPGDTDLKAAYVKILNVEAKDLMAQHMYNEVIPVLELIKRYGDNESYKAAQNSLFTAYLELKDYNNALNVLNDIQQTEPNNPLLYLKKADLYYNLKRFDMALASYEQAFPQVSEEEKLKYLGSYGDMLTQIVKDLNDQYRYDEAMTYVERWLENDPNNQTALRYAVNLSNQRKKMEDMKTYAQRGADAYPDEIFFKLKLMEVDGLDPEKYASIYSELQTELTENPYHQDVIKSFAVVSEKYGNQLIKNSQSQEALDVLNNALKYMPDNKDLKYTKGLAFEKLKQFDSAYVYQKNFQPSLLELKEFREHMNYLRYKSFRNEIGLYHLRSRFADIDVLTTISTLEYSRYGIKDTYIGRINYTGREPGKGFQIQGEWQRNWDEKTRTKIDLAWANQFFPTLAANASVFRDLAILNGIEAELGVGYRKLYQGGNLMNVVVGATKLIDPWRLNLRVNNYMLDGQWLYNVSTNIRYYLTSPKNYLIAMGSVGSSPDVDLINYQLHNGFSVTNSMVGAGFSHLLTSSVSTGILGTWNHYKSDQDTFRSLYNIYMNLNVSF